MSEFHRSDFESWVHSQRVAYAAYFLRCFSRHGAEGFSEASYAQVERLADFLAQAVAGLDRGSARSLLPFALTTLLEGHREGDWANVAGDPLAATVELRRDMLDKALRLLCHEGDIPLHSWTAVLAHHVMHGRTTGRAFLREWSLRLNHNGKGNPPGAFAPEAEHIIATLADPLGALDRRRAQILALREVMERSGRLGDEASKVCWAQFCNHLYHHIFAWPLLVFPGLERSFGLATAIPVHVGVRFSSADRNNQYVHVLPTTDTDWLSVQSWERHMVRSVWVAKKLWRSKHGMFQGFKTRVRHAQVTFDFRVAESIARNLFPLAVEDSSAETYFSQIVLAKFLGSADAAASAITGSAGKQREAVDEFGMLLPLMDFEFHAPDGLPEKVRYVFASRMFERVVLPAQDANDSEALLESLFDTERTAQTVEVNRCGTVSNVCDIVQAQGWRQYRFVRCPDVANRFRHAAARTRTAPRQSRQVEALCEELRTANKPVVRVKLDARVVADALAHVNYHLRVADAQPRPSISIAFLRCVQNEAYDRFWQNIWELVGAPDATWSDFAHATTTPQAAEILEGVLNTAVPSDQLPSYRAPDVIVLLDAQWHNESLNSALLKSAMHRRALLSVANTISQRDALAPTHLSDLIGKTRIIIVEAPDAVADEPAPQITSKLLEVDDTFEATVIDALSVVRFGFTHGVAAAVLRCVNVPGREVLDLLMSLVEKGYLRGPVNNEFFLPVAYGRRASPSQDPLVCAELHVAAAHAFAPYLGDLTTSPGLSMDRSLLPWNAGAAAFHLRQAYGLARQLTRDLSERGRRAKELALASRAGLRHTVLHVDRDGWVKVDELRRWDVEAAIDLAEELSSLRDPDSEVLFRMARCYQDLGDKRSSARGRALELYERALSVGEGNARQQLLILAYYTICLADHLNLTFDQPPISDHVRRLRQLVQQLAPHEPKIWRLVPGEWFERAGDAAARPELAVKDYYTAIRHVPEYHTAWLRYVGAALLTQPAETVRKTVMGLIADNDVSLTEVLSKTESYYGRYENRSALSRSHMLLGFLALSKWFDYRAQNGRFWRDMCGAYLQQCRERATGADSLAAFVLALTLRLSHRQESMCAFEEGIRELCKNLRAHDFWKHPRARLIATNIRALETELSTEPHQKRRLSIIQRAHSKFIPQSSSPEVNRAN